MVNGVGRIHKLGKYNRQQYVVTDIPFNTNLPNSKNYDKYNEKR